MEITFTTKKKGKEIILSEFLILIRRLYISDFMPNYQLLQNKNWPLNKYQNPRHYCTKLL